MTTWYNDVFSGVHLELLTAHTPDSGGTYVQLIGNTPQIFTSVASKNMVGPGTGGGYAVTRTPSIAPAADAKFPFTMHNSGGTQAFLGVGLRISGTGTGTRGYVGIYNTANSKLEIYKLDASGQVTILLASQSGTFTFASGSAYSGEFSVVGSLLTMSLDTATVSVTDASITAVGYGAIVFNALQGNGIFFDAASAQDITTAATAITTSGPAPATGNVGAASAPITIGANGVITGTVAVSYDDNSGGGTFSPASPQNISSGTPTVAPTYTPGTNGVKTLRFTNNGGLTNPANISYTANAVGAPTAGVASFVSATASTINVSATAATGGTAPLTYQWYRSTVANTVGSALSGATSLTLADSASLSANVPYYYTCRATDAAALTADTNQIAGALKAATLKLGFIGDSITFGFGLSAGQDPASQIVPILKKTYKNRDVTATNSAVSGSKSSQWVTGQSNLTTAKSAFASAGVTHVHCMLGANDAAVANLVSAATFKSNLQSTITDLTGAGYKVILSYPTYLPAGANSGATTAASVALAQSYQAQIDSLIDNVNVLRGDTLSFNYFMDNLGEYQADQTHPTATGALALATMWARAIDRSVLDAAASPTLTSRTVSLTLKLDAATLAANLTGIKVSFWDEPSTELTTTARYQSATETMDASGVLTFSCGSTLAPGGTGYIDIRGAGLHYCAPVAVA